MKLRFPYATLLIAIAAAAQGCAVHTAHNLPPAERLMEPGPGVGGPGPGVIPPLANPGAMGGGDIGMAGGYMDGGYGGYGGGAGCLPGGGVVGAAVQDAFQVLFSDANQMEGMQVRWDVGGVGMFDSEPLVSPGRVNFPQAGRYWLKLTNIPERVGVELYPTLEITPTTPRSEAYLAHNAIPIQFTNEDFDQVEANSFVVKVIYLPDPEFQELAQAGIETIVSTRLDPGVDPIVEADRRGAILAIVRLGNKDIQLPGGGGEGGIITQAAYGEGDLHGPPGAGGYIGGPGGAGPMPIGPGNIGQTGLIPSHIAGLSTPNWGMPWTGTPIGLPGPPHIPLGAPAGLQKHWIKNHTHMYIPTPPHSVGVHVKQNPGYSYPRPASRVRIYEQNIRATQPYRQPRHDYHRTIH